MIDGACISTGQIDVDYIYLHDQMEVFDGRYSGGYIGYCSGYSDDGIGAMNSSSTGQCMVLTAAQSWHTGTGSISEIAQQYLCF